jgi:hypothetical protein
MVKLISIALNILTPIGGDTIPNYPQFIIYDADRTGEFFCLFVMKYQDNDELQILNRRILV